MLLTGWGRTHRSWARAVRPTDVADALRVMASDPASPFVPRGAGSSYGDAATCDRGSVLDLTACDRLVELDPSTGVVTAEAGMTIGQLMRVLVGSGWTVPVLPGTPHVTLGGAVAADVHGKNHVGAGSFGAHVRWLVLMDPQGSPQRLSPPLDARFWATVGGMGLTGPILVVALQLRPIGTAPASVRRVRAASLEGVMQHLEDLVPEQRVDAGVHAVAWLDATRGHEGRGLVQVTRTPGPDRHRPLADGAVGTRPVPPRTSRARSGSPTSRALPGNGLISERLITAANAARWHWPQRRAEQQREIVDALIPLRRAEVWPAMFGRGGLLQYQFVVPLGQGHVIQTALTTLATRRLTPALVVLKRLGPSSAAPLGFALEGWTVALDLPAGWAGLGVALDELDELVGHAGGRVYLAKDSRLRPDLVGQMYPQLETWRQVRDHMDPHHRFCSDLDRRLRLTRDAEA